MCLMVFALRPGESQPFVFGTNRDEFHDRPTEPARFWPRYPHVLAGRDREAGGTWCGCTQGGRFAAVSNFRDPGGHRPEAPSRGDLVRRFLVEEPDPRAYLDDLVGEADRYNGFNLLLGRLESCELYYFSNRGGAPERLEPGVYGLSNHLLDTPWYKVRRTKRRLAQLLEEPPIRAEPVLDLLGSTERAPPEELPETGLDPETEHLVSAPFIVDEAYGTRSTTVLLVRADGTTEYVERRYDRAGAAIDTSRWTFSIDLSLRTE